MPAVATPDSLMPGDVFGEKYVLLEPIAVGGMGCVWRAENLATGAEVAAKFILPSQAASPDAIIRFRREARATAALSHRAIVRVFDLIEIDSQSGSLVMILELLHGRTLASRIEEMGPLSVDETLEIALPILSALAHAHGLGIVHRDLKPENVFLGIDPDGSRVPRLVDFGVSKVLRESRITLDGVIVGTLSYLSPEQTCGGEIDPRTDLHAMGVLLYECLSGRNPYESSFEDGGPGNLMSVFDSAPWRPDSIPDPLWAVIQKALAFRPEDRFESAVELAQALRAAVAPAPTVETRDSEPGTRTRLPRTASRPAIATRGAFLAIPPRARTWATALALSVAAVVWGGHLARAHGTSLRVTASAVSVPHHKVVVRTDDQILEPAAEGDSPLPHVPTTREAIRRFASEAAWAAFARLPAVRGNHTASMLALRPSRVIAREPGF